LVILKNNTAGQAYLNSTFGYVFKAQANPSLPPDNFPYPTFRKESLTPNEHVLQSSLNNLEDAIVTRFDTYEVEIAFSVDLFAIIGYENGWSCINKSMECWGDNRDSRYRESVRGMNLSLNTDDFIIGLGVIHTNFNKATYTSLSVYWLEKTMGVGGVVDTQMDGSANTYIPNDPNNKYLYAYKFSRNCSSSEQYCYTVPYEFPGVPLNQTIRFIERAYVEPTTLVGPTYNTTLGPVFLHFYKNTNKYEELLN